MPTPDASKGDQSRAEILDAARELFLRSGYNGTSMRAIAQAAGDRAVAGIYNHFPNKAAIFAALLEERSPYQDLYDILENTQADTAPDFIRQVVHKFVVIMPRHYDFFLLVQIDLREMGGEHISRLLRTQALPRVLRSINKLQTLPGLRPIEPLALMRLLASQMLGYIITDNLAPYHLFGYHTPGEWADLIADTLLDGLADPESAAAPVPRDRGASST